VQRERYLSFHFHQYDLIFVGKTFVWGQDLSSARIQLTGKRLPQSIPYDGNY
jgi:hypothetical protein